MQKKERETLSHAYLFAKGSLKIHGHIKISFPFSCINMEQEGIAHVPFRKKAAKTFKRQQQAMRQLTFWKLKRKTCKKGFLQKSIFWMLV